MDNKTESQRRENMSRIRSKDTGPEKTVRRVLFRMGCRFRLNRKDLPGKPDIVMPKYRLAIFIQGCFWHQHPGCSRAVLPKSRQEYWHQKLARNVERDIANREELLKNGWRVLWVWECSLKTKASLEALPEKLKHWIAGTEKFGQI